MPTYSVPLHVTASAIRRRIMMSAPPGNGYVIQSDSTANEGYSWVLLGGGGGGTSNHAALSNLGWTYSGHTHTGTGIAGFNGAGAAIVYGYGTAGGVAAYNTTVASFGALTPVEGKWLGYSSGALTWSTPTAAVDWVTFVGQASNPGGASTTSTLYMSDGTEYDVGTLVWSRKTVFREALSIGEPGTEQADIVLGGVTYTVPAKVNAFGTARAGCVLHQHSDTVEPDLVFARARGTTSSHTIVQDTDIFGRVIFGGWLNSTIGYARGAEIRAHADGTISTTSMPTRIDFATCGSGATSVTDRWCILPNGTFRPAADNTYQIGNTSYALTEAWARQWMFLEQAAVTAPAGGWAGRSGIWARNDTPTSPMFTDDAGTSSKLIRETDIATTSVPGIAEVATYLEGQSAGSLRVEDAREAHNLYRSGFYGWGIVTASPFDNNFEGSGCLSVTAGTGTFTGFMDATAGAYLTFPTSTTTSRGIYAGDGAGGLEWPYTGHLRYVFRFGGNSTFRIYGGLCSWGGTANMVAAETSTALAIRFGIDAGTIRAICGDGVARTKQDFTTSPGASTIYEWEIIPNRAMTSVIFNLYSYTSTGGRGALLETKTITNNIPSTAVKAVPLVWTIATSGTPTAYWHSMETVGNSV